MKILFAGGGSGGHIFPIIAIVREIRKLAKESKKDISFYYLGPKNEQWETLLSQEEIKTKRIWAGKLRRYFGPIPIIQNIVDVFIKLPFGFLQSFFSLFFSAPDIIFCLGGYASLPVALAGFLLRTPIFLQELDVTPGFVNKILSKIASEIFVSFSVKEIKHFPINKMISVGNPIRSELLTGSKEMAKKIFNLSGDRPIILVLGGSQGAQKINDLILQILPEILADFEIIHQCGEKNLIEANSKSDAILSENKTLKNYYHLFSFLDEEKLKHAYAAADLILSRAGSGTIFESAAVGKPSILIPLLGSAQNHQIKNAYAYAKTGASIIIEEPNLTSPRFFLEKLKDLISQKKELEKMRLAAKEFSKPQAAKIIANYILSIK